MEKRIVFVGESLVQSENVTYIAYGADDSLLDGDIVVFSIDISSYSSNGNTFHGMRCLEDDSSFHLRRDTQHWRSELSAALMDGKTVIVFANKAPILSVATGQKEFSGSGRNARATRIVEEFDPYSAIPCTFGSVIRRSGDRIKATGDLGILATYWHEFGDFSPYEAYIDNFKGTPLLETQTGHKAVGGILRLPSWKGALIFIPSPDLAGVVDDRIKSFKARQKKGPAPSAATKARRAESYRKKAEQSVASQFIAAVVALDKSARSASESTPPPAWAQENRFNLTRESRVQSQLLKNLAKAQTLLEERTSLEQDLQKAQSLKSLLFEKGKPLEGAILDALRTAGFKAENLQEADSEFDAVMVDPTGIRLIGEAEGKDDKAINVDKLDQLDRNIKEDFSRQDDENARFAKGVLFGNAYRLSSPDDRHPFFTNKCLLAAKRSHISLVRTIDLFAIAQYLDNNSNAKFAADCRRAMIEADGEVVMFPEVPSGTSTS